MIILAFEICACGVRRVVLGLILLIKCRFLAAMGDREVLESGWARKR